MACKSKIECFTPSAHSRVCADRFTEDSFEENIVVRSLLKPSVNLSATTHPGDIPRARSEFSDPGDTSWRQIALFDVNFAHLHYSKI